MEGSCGTPRRIQVQNYNRPPRRDPWMRLGRDSGVWAPILSGDGSLPSHAALLSAAVKWAQAALLARQLFGAAARFHFSGLRLAWMSLIAQRSASPSPGPRVRGTPGRNLTQI